MEGHGAVLARSPGTAGGPSAARRWYCPGMRAMRQPRTAPNLIPTDVNTTGKSEPATWRKTDWQRADRVLTSLLREEKRDHRTRAGRVTPRNQPLSPHPRPQGNSVAPALPGRLNPLSLRRGKLGEWQWEGF